MFDARFYKFYNFKVNNVIITFNRLVSVSLPTNRLTRNKCFSLQVKISKVNIILYGCYTAVEECVRKRCG